jgi:hypothetical protein
MKYRSDEICDPEKESRLISRRWYLRTAGGTVFAALTGCAGIVDHPETILEQQNESVALPRSSPESHNEPDTPVSADEFVVFNNEELEYTIQHPVNWESNGDGTAVVTVTADTDGVTAVISVTTSDSHLDFPWDAEGRQAVVETARAHLWAHDWRANTTDANFALSSGRLALFFDVESPAHVRELSLWVVHKRQLYQLVAQAPAPLFTARVERLVVRMFRSLRIADEVEEDNGTRDGPPPMAADASAISPR